MSGLEHLDAAIATGRGAFLCAFHVASYSMLPFILAARGYAQTVLMEASGDAGPQMRNRVRELQKAGYAYMLDVVNVGYGIRRLVRALQQGKIVLLLFDATVAPGGEHVTTPFLGRSLRVAKGVGWLSGPARPCCP